RPLVVTLLASDDAPSSVPEGYLKLHLLSHRLVKPHEIGRAACRERGEGQGDVGRNNAKADAVGDGTEGTQHTAAGGDRLDAALVMLVGFALNFFFQAEHGIRDFHVTGVQTCALPICVRWWLPCWPATMRPAACLRAI